MIETVFGILLLALGGFVLAAVSNPLEIAVYSGGPVIAVLGLIMAIFSALRRRIAPALFGGVAVVLGALLATHDLLFSPGIAVSIHLGLAIAILTLGLVQLAAKKRFYSRWFRKGPSDASKASGGVGFR